MHASFRLLQVQITTGSGEVLHPFVVLAQSNPIALPADKVTARLLEGFAATAARRTPGSAKFEGMHSSATDVFHAIVPAAYCDVFTCDALVAQWLGDARQTLGLRRQLARGDFPSEDDFVAALASTFP